MKDNLAHLPTFHFGKAGGLARIKRIRKNSHEEHEETLRKYYVNVRLSVNSVFFGVE